ncbi:hypothetical protein Tco_1570534 [Tanacetum coccineum]
MVDDLLSTRIRYVTRTTLQSYTKEFEKKAQEKRKLYIHVVEKLVKDIIKDEVKSLLPQILPKVVSDFATPVIQTSLTEFELKKIMLDKLEKSKSYRAAEDHRNLYDALVKSYQLDKDLFDSYGKAYSLKRSREDKDKDEDLPAGPDQGLKKKKTSKDVKPSRGSKSKESKSSSFKGSKSQSKSSGKFAQAEEPVLKIADTEMLKDQGDDMGNTEDQPNVEETLMDDWFKKPERPPTPNPDWNATKFVDSRPPQKWISRIAQAEKPPLTFDELMSTHIDFLEYVMHNLKISPVNVAYDKFSMWGISHWGLKRQKFYGYASNREFKHDVFSRKRIIVTHVKVMKWYGYCYLEEIIFRREDQTLHKFKECDFPRLNLRDIEDQLLLLVQKKLSNLEKDVIFNLNVALRMFTRRIVILKRVEDLQLEVKSYQKKLNITKPETFRSGISKLTPYTAYKKTLKESSIKISSRETG